MVILFEEYPYSRDLADKYLSSMHSLAIVDNGSDPCSRRINGVGYFLETKEASHVFVLPKNFVIDGKAFGVLKISPDAAIDDSKETRELLNKNGWSDSLLSTLPIYLYQAIDKYRNQVLDSFTAEEDFSREILTSKSGEKELTLLDITLSLQRFYRENQNLFVMVYKQSHSGYNKVLWSKTVRKATPIINDDEVIYPLVINQRKTINYDEELLVIFFNTLRYLNNKYQFHTVVDQPYNLMSDSEFERKLDRGIILRRLYTIKNNYFNEKMVRLWDLLFAFASKLSFVRKPGAKGDYLFIRNFENVFETMIDTLLSDSDAPNILINQKDNKEVDHLFKGRSITSDTLDIYYIGDSKYYISGRRPKYSALFKQYTYAKNIIQTEIDWFYSGQHEHLKYRDALSEGYNLTPNFFISGKVEAGYSFTDDHLEMPQDTEGKPLPEAFQKSFQFPNRIFDRDTLFLMQVDVNILFVIAAYVSRSQTVRTEFKKKATDAFKREFIHSIEQKYDFYLLKVRDGCSVDDALDRHFRALNGKVFCPYPNGHEHFGLLMMGLERKEFVTNMKLILSLQEDYIVKEYHLGTEPYLYYLGLLDGIETSRSLVLKEGLKTTFENHKRESVIITSFPSKEDLYKAVENRRIPIPLADLVNRCSGSGCQPIFTSAYVFLYCSDNPMENVLGYALTGRSAYNEDSGMLYYEIDPMRIGGSFEISQIISKHTRGTNEGPFFLSFEDASDDFYSND